jgi:hypothetical protein
MTTSLSAKARLAVDPERLGEYLRDGGVDMTTAASDDAPGVREPDDAPGVREPDDAPGVREPDDVPGVREPDDAPGVREPDDTA